MLETVKKWLKENPHAYAWFYFVYYLAHFLFLEKCVEPKYILHSVMDDYIPFNDTWIIFYLAWFPYFIGSLIYLTFKDGNKFLKLAFSMFTGMTIALWICTFWPNGLNLRTGNYSNDVFGWLASFIQSVDTPGNVCPSIHVASSFAVGLFVARDKDQSLGLRVFAMTLTVLISISTMYLKQHSFIDVVAGFALAIAVDVFVNCIDYQKLLKKCFPVLFKKDN